MNSMTRLHQLFVKHLRVIYDGEKTMATALHTMYRTTNSPSLQRFYRMKAGEKEQVLAALQKIFTLLHTHADGETDPIIESFMRRSEAVNPEYDAIYIALMITGRALNVYQVNAITTAVSSAEDLGMFDVAELLKDCGGFLKFNKEEQQFLEEELEKAVAVPAEIIAA